MKLLCLGDSNTYGYDPRSLYGDRYPVSTRWTSRIDPWEVLNCGMNGLAVPTDGKLWQNLIEERNPDLVTVMLGSNDLLEHRTAEETSNRMSVFLQYVIHAGKPVLLISPPYLKSGTWVQHETQILESRKLSRLYRDLANKLGTYFVDAEAWSVELSFDGVHFTESGHLAFAQGLKNYLLKNLSERRLIHVFQEAVD